MVALERQLSKKEAMPKDTTNPNMTENFKGWSREGIKRYTNLIKVMRRNNLTTHSKEMEFELKGNYAKVCGKNGRRNGNGE